MENQYVENDTATVGTSSVTLFKRVLLGQKRIEFAITNTSSTQDVYIFMGNIAAVSGSGIKLTPNTSFIQSTDAGSSCWQGEVQCIASAAAGSVAIMQRIADVK